MTSGGGFDERQRQEPCVEWTRDDGTTRGEGNQEGTQQPAGRANKRRSRGKQEARALANMRRRCGERASVDNVRLASGGQQRQE